MNISKHWLVAGTTVFLVSLSFSGDALAQCSRGGGPSSTSTTGFQSLASSGGVINPETIAALRLRDMEMRQQRIAAMQESFRMRQQMIAAQQERVRQFAEYQQSERNELMQSRRARAEEKRRIRAERIAKRKAAMESSDADSSETQYAAASSQSSSPTSLTSLVSRADPFGT